MTALQRCRQLLGLEPALTWQACRFLAAAATATPATAGTISDHTFTSYTRTYQTSSPPGTLANQQQHTASAWPQHRWYSAASEATSPTVSIPVYEKLLRQAEKENIGIRRKLVTVLYKQDRPLTSDEVWREVETLGGRSKNHTKKMLQLMKTNKLIETTRMTDNLKEHRNRFGYQLTQYMRDKIAKITSKWEDVDSSSNVAA